MPHMSESIGCKYQTTQILSLTVSPWSRATSRDISPCGNPPGWGRGGMLAANRWMEQREDAGSLGMVGVEGQEALGHRQPAGLVLYAQARPGVFDARPEAFCPN